MAGLPTRPPSVGALSPEELSHEIVEVDKIYIPANALIIAENEQIFLAIASILKELRAVLIGGTAGYVYFGKINRRIVFLLKPRGPTMVIQSIKTLRPKAGIFVGFCKTLQIRPSDSQSRSFEVGDVIIAETVLRKSSKQGKLEIHACSEYLINVFEHGKFGWSPPKYRKQVVHVGSILQMGPDLIKNEKATAMAEKTTNLDVTECCKGLGKEWISIVGVVDTQRCHSDTSWAQYVAAVMGSFVKKVLHNDQVFAILGGEALAPREHSPLLSSPLQETVSLKGSHLTDCDITQDQVQRRAEINWAQVKEALVKGQFHLPKRRAVSEISLKNFTTVYRTPVENSEEKLSDKKPVLSMCEQATNPAAPVSWPQSSEKGVQRPSGRSQRTTLPPLPSNNAGNTERKIAPPDQGKVSGHAHSYFPTLTSSIMATVKTTLLPLGASVQSQGSHVEIIEIRSEERATISKQGALLPAITRENNKT